MAMVFNSVRDAFHAWMRRIRWSKMVAEAEEIFYVTPRGAFSSYQLRRVVAKLFMRQQKVQKHNAEMIRFYRDPRAYVAEYLRGLNESNQGSLNESSQEVAITEMQVHSFREFLELNVDAVTVRFDRACKVAEFFQPGIVEQYKQLIFASDMAEFLAILEEVNPSDDSAR
jgi:hypothetical protein